MFCMCPSKLHVQLTSGEAKWMTQSFETVLEGIRSLMLASFGQLRKRQGGVLSPYLFSIFIDDLVKYVIKASVVCRIRVICTAIFLYADDVILLAPSVCALQSLGGYLCC